MAAAPATFDHLSAPAFSSTLAQSGPHSAPLLIAHLALRPLMERKMTMLRPWLLASVAIGLFVIAPGALTPPALTPPTPSLAQPGLPASRAPRV